MYVSFIVCTCISISPKYMSWDILWQSK